MSACETTWYAVLRDMGSLIGGILALGAGGLAYWAGVQQAAVARRQIATTVRENSKDRVRASSIACRQITGVLNRIRHDAMRKRAHIGTHLQPSGSTVPVDFAQSLAQPDILSMLSALSMTDEAVVDGYMRLDAEMVDYKTTAIYSAPWHANRLAVLIDTTENLLNHIGPLAATFNARLVELSK